MQNKLNQRLPWACCALLVALTAALYWPAHRFDFVNYDDPVYVTENAQVQAGLTWQGVAWALTAVHASNWHPLTWLSHMADAQLFGRMAGGPHTINVLLHTINSLLVFLVLLRLTGKALPSVLVAGLFAWHPLHVESVAWISERKDTLSCLWALLALWFCAGYAQRRTGAAGGGQGTRHYLAALVCFVLGLLSKPMVVTLPFVLLLLDVWPLRRASVRSAKGADWGPLLREKAPFFLLAAASSVLTFWAQSRGGAVASLSHIPLDQRIANALVAYVVYLRKTAWPADLAVFYPHPGALVWGAAVLSAAVLALTTTAALWQASRRPWLAVGWFWYLGTLVPVIGLVQVGNQAYADRYTYLPLIGIFVALAWGASEWASSSRRKAGCVCLAFGTALAAYGAATHRQLQYWENSETLFRRALAVTDRNYLAHHGLAYHLAAAGKREEAQAHYEQALAIRPTYYEAHLNLGMLLLAKEDLDRAAEHLRLALELNPGSVEGHYNYGVVLGRQGQDEEAVIEFGKVAELQADHLNAHYNLGLALAKLGRAQEAEEHYRQAIRLGELRAEGADARLALPHYNLGLLLQQQGRMAEAQEQFAHAARLRALHPPRRN